MATIGSSIRRRIWGTLAGNAFTRVIRVAEQLFLVPVFFATWGAERYGEWIALNSIALFITLCNFGIGHAGMSDIILRYASGDRRGAGRSFATSTILITLVVIVAFATLSAVLHWGDVRRFVSLQSISVDEAIKIIEVATLAALLTFYGEPLGGVIGAARGATLPSMLFALSKGVELLGVAAVLILGGSPIQAAIVMLGATLVNLTVNVIAACWVAPWISFSFRDFDFAAVQRTWRASLGFFLLLICMAVFDGQAPRLIVFHYFSATALASFSTFVIYTRAARLLALTISQATQVEIGRAFAHGLSDQAKELIETIIGSALGIGGLILLGELALAPIVIPLWTHGHVAVAWEILVPLSLVALAGAYFDAVMAAVAAINQVGRAAIGYGSGLAFGLLAGILALPVLGAGSIALGLVVPECTGALAGLLTLRRTTPPLAVRPIPSSFWPKSLMTAVTASDEHGVT